MSASIPAASSFSLQVPTIHKLPVVSHGDIAVSSPSPPPSHITFERPAPCLISGVWTHSVSGLSMRPKLMRAATLTVPPSLTLSIQVSRPLNSNFQTQIPRHWNLQDCLPLIHSHILRKRSREVVSASNGVDFDELMTPYYTPPHTPFTPKPAFLPYARPDQLCG